MQIARIRGSFSHLGMLPLRLDMSYHITNYNEPTTSIIIASSSV